MFQSRYLPVNAGNQDDARSFSGASGAAALHHPHLFSPCSLCSLPLTLNSAGESDAVNHLCSRVLIHLLICTCAAVSAHPNILLGLIFAAN